LISVIFAKIFYEESFFGYKIKDNKPGQSGPFDGTDKTF
jgi:hypothetical protein